MEVLFVNHKEERCGVYQMGRRIAEALETGRGAHRYTYLETTAPTEVLGVLERGQFGAVVYNYHPNTMPWAPAVAARRPDLLHAAIEHEIDYMHASGTPTAPFDLRLVGDPSFPADNSRTFRFVRPIPDFVAELREPTEGQPLTVGSFGLATGGKMFDQLIKAVAEEFGAGTRLRLHLPVPGYDNDARDTQKTAAACVLLGRSLGLEVAMSHHFLPKEELLAFLAGNDLNVFFYENQPGRGISSVIDYAVAAQRPIAISQSNMFRHVQELLGTYPQKSLGAALRENGDLVRGLASQWSCSQLVRDLEAALDSGVAQGLAAMRPTGDAELPALDGLARQRGGAPRALWHKVRRSLRRAAAMRGLRRNSESV